MLVKQLLELINFDKVKSIKIAAIVTVVGFIHSYLYMPYHTEKLFESREFNQMVRDAVKTNFADFQAKELSLELKLSEELSIPLHLVPHKISAVIKLSDSARRRYPEFEMYKKIIPVGIILNGTRIMYVDHKGLFRYPKEDSSGFFRYLNNGEKHYLYFK